MNLKMGNLITTSYEDWDKLIQPLIELMTKEYRNGYELVITPIGAEIRQNNCVQTFLNNSIANSKIEFPSAPEEVEELWNSIFKKPED